MALLNLTRQGDALSSARTLQAPCIPGDLRTVRHNRNYRIHEPGSDKENSFSSRRRGWLHALATERASDPAMVRIHLHVLPGEDPGEDEVPDGQ